MFYCPSINKQTPVPSQKQSYTRPFLLAFAIACLLVLGTTTTAQADPVFLFQFDATPDGTVTPPIVGTGSFSFANDPGNGTHALTSLGAFNMSFTFGGVTFTEAHITTPLNQILVVLSTQGTDRRVQFSNINAFGTGTFQGSIDFVNGVNGLSFEPPAFGGNLDLYFLNNTGFGNYSGLAGPVPAVPEPMSMMLLGTGLAGVALKIKRRRKPHQSKET